MIHNHGFSYAKLPFAEQGLLATLKHPNKPEPSGASVSLLRFIAPAPSFAPRARHRPARREAWAGTARE
jgi:hypothetical protein